MKQIAVKPSKNALHAGPRQRIDYEVGQTVYFWRKGMEGAKKNAPEYWRGPCRVILTSPPNTIWVNYRGYIVKAAPEHLRLASEEEQFTLSKWIDDITETKKELDTVPRQGYIDLTTEPIPLEDEPLEDMRHLNPTLAPMFPNSDLLEKGISRTLSSKETTEMMNG